MEDSLYQPTLHPPAPPLEDFNKATMDLILIIGVTVMGILLLIVVLMFIWNQLQHSPRALHFFKRSNEGDPILGEDINKPMLSQRH